MSYLTQIFHLYRKVMLRLNIVFIVGFCVLIAFWVIIYDISNKRFLFFVFSNIKTSMNCIIKHWMLMYQLSYEKTIKATSGILLLQILLLLEFRAIFVIFSRYFLKSLLLNKCLLCVSYQKIQFIHPEVHMSTL